MKNNTAIYVVIAGILLLSGCGSGGGGGGDSSPATPPSATQAIKIYYDSPNNTKLQAEGLVLVGPDGKPTATKHGLWTTYFEEKDSAGKELTETQKIYVNGTWDEQQNWTEYNLDTSIRNTMLDAIF
jgi:hypothetical protein